MKTNSNFAIDQRYRKVHNSSLVSTFLGVTRLYPVTTFIRFQKSAAFRRPPSRSSLPRLDLCHDPRYGESVGWRELRLATIAPTHAQKIDRPV